MGQNQVVRLFATLPARQKGEGLTSHHVHRHHVGDRVDVVSRRHSGIPTLIRHGGLVVHCGEYNYYLCPNQLLNKAIKSTCTGL